MSDAVLEEVYDPDYEPTQKEIDEYAEFLGMNLEEDTELFWIAREGLKAPLPPAWKPCQTDTGDVYYYNFESKESIWDHPCDEFYRSMYQREKAKLAGGGGGAGAGDDDGGDEGDGDCEASPSRGSQHEDSRVSEPRSDGGDAHEESIKQSSSKESNRSAPHSSASGSRNNLNTSRSGLPLLSISGSKVLGAIPASTMAGNSSSADALVRSRTASSSRSLSKLSAADGGPLGSKDRLRSRTGSASSIASAASEPSRRTASKSASHHSLASVKEHHSSRSSAASSPRGLPVSLPSLQSAQSARQLESLQRTIDQQNEHVTELEAEIRELRDRLRIQEQVVVERQRRHDQDVQMVTARLTVQHDEAMAKLRSSLVEDRERALDDLRESLSADHDAAVAKATRDGEARGRATTEAQIAEARNAHAREIAQLRSELEKRNAETRDLQAQLDRDTHLHADEQREKDEQLRRALKAIQDLERALSVAREQQSTPASRSAPAPAAVVPAPVFLKPTRSTLVQTDPAPPTLGMATQTDPMPATVSSKASVEVESSAPHAQPAAAADLSSAAEGSRVSADALESQEASYTDEYSETVTSTADSITSDDMRRRRRRQKRHGDKDSDRSPTRSLKSPRPVLLKSRVHARPAKETYIETVPIPTLDNELNEVKGHLHSMLNKIHARRHRPLPSSLGTNDLSPPIRRLPTTPRAATSFAPAAHVASPDLNLFERECMDAERKLREHTSWLRGFISSLDGSSPASNDTGAWV
ncbi:hypothetical protein H9P43_003411 [Blastocladiella emersonii ATCC 22665]|nr:hypothetical protein H9P43_003411 [Blastocladiella emersonii ATCC 22665]